jgi:hypothetical protein
MKRRGSESPEMLDALDFPDLEVLTFESTIPFMAEGCVAVENQANLNNSAAFA